MNNTDRQTSSSPLQSCVGVFVRAGPLVRVYLTALVGLPSQQVHWTLTTFALQNHLLVPRTEDNKEAGTFNGEGEEVEDRGDEWIIIIAGQEH